MIAVQISRAPGIFAHTLVVTLTPLYMIINQMNIPVKVYFHYSIWNRLNNKTHLRRLFYHLVHLLLFHGHHMNNQQKLRFKQNFWIMDGQNHSLLNQVIIVFNYSLLRKMIIMSFLMSFQIFLIQLINHLLFSLLM